MKNFSVLYGTGAASFCLKPEPTQVGRSWSRVQDLGHQEAEPEAPTKSGGSTTLNANLLQKL